MKNTIKNLLTIGAAFFVMTAPIVASAADSTYAYGTVLDSTKLISTTRVGGANVSITDEGGRYAPLAIASMPNGAWATVKSRPIRLPARGNGLDLTITLTVTNNSTADFVVKGNYSPDGVTLVQPPVYLTNSQTAGSAVTPVTTAAKVTLVTTTPKVYADTTYTNVIHVPVNQQYFIITGVSNANTAYITMNGIIASGWK